MTYTAYDPALPDAATQNGTAFAGSTRANLQAMRDVIVAMGGMPGFNYSVSGGTAEQPASLFYKRGAEWIKVDLTWGTTGGADGNVTKAAYYYSSTSGGAYDGMVDGAGNYVQAMSYDSNGNLTTTTWSATP
jgi:hypothetical protein